MKNFEQAIGTQRVDKNFKKQFTKDSENRVNVIQKPQYIDIVKSKKNNFSQGVGIQSLNGKKPFFYDESGNMVISADFMASASGSQLARARDFMIDAVDTELRVKICWIIYTLQISYRSELARILSISEEKTGRLLDNLMDKGYIETDNFSSAYIKRMRLKIRQFGNTLFYRLNENMPLHIGSDITVEEFIQKYRPDPELEYKVGSIRADYAERQAEIDEKDREQAIKRMEKKVRDLKKNPFLLITSAIDDGRHIGKVANHDKIRDIIAFESTRRLNETLDLGKRKIKTVRNLLINDGYIAADNNVYIFVRPE